MTIEVTTTAELGMHKLDDLRATLVGRVWGGLLVVACLAVPISLARTYYTGWQPAYAVHFFMLLVLGGGFIIRDVLAYRLRAVMLVILLDLNGVGSVVSFGLLGASWWGLFASSLLVALVFHMRAGLLHAAGAIILIAVLGLLFVQGWLGMGFDANVYSRQFLPWATLVLGPVLFAAFVIWACAAFLGAASDATANEL